MEGGPPNYWESYFQILKEIKLRAVNFGAGKEDEKGKIMRGCRNAFGMRRVPRMGGGKSDTACRNMLVSLYGIRGTGTTRF